jgi:hypothetical protein
MTYDPKLVPKVADLIQGRCNFPAELTKRTELWRNRGKARCKKSVRDGVYFCHLPMHKEFAIMNQLPLEETDKTKRRRKGEEDHRGQKVDEEPMRPSFRRNPRKRKSDDVEEENQINPDINQVKLESIVTRVVSSLHREDEKRLKTTSVKNESEMSLLDPLEAAPDAQCVFINPMSGYCCRNIGIYSDQENPDCYFCPEHVKVSPDLIEEAKRTGDRCLVRDLETIILLDEKFSNETETKEKQRLSLKRFSLASNYGLGTLPDVLHFIH